MTTSPTQSSSSQVQDQNGHIFREVFRRLAGAKLETCSAGFHAPGQMGEDTHAIRTGMRLKFPSDLFYWNKMRPNSRDVIRPHTKIGAVVYFNGNALINTEIQVVKIPILSYPDRMNLLFDVSKGAKELGKYLLFVTSSCENSWRRSAETSSIRGNLRVTKQPPNATPPRHMAQVRPTIPW